MQVKSSSCLSEGAYFLTTQRCCNGQAIPYTPQEVDFLAGYIFPEDAWVIIPVAALAGRKSLHIFPSDRAQQGIYALYREAWCQLACPREHSHPPTSAPDSPNKRKTDLPQIQPRCKGQGRELCPLHLQPRTRLARARNPKP